MRSRIHALGMAAVVVHAAGACGYAEAQVQVSGSGARGSITQSLSVGATALLHAFDVDFGFGRDHQLRTFQVMPSEGQNRVTVTYSDKNGDDAFAYRAAFFGSGGASTQNGDLVGQCRGTCDASLVIPSGMVFVLRGVQLGFSDADHHIQTIGVEPSSGRVRVYMRDKNGDDRFSYRIRYALVPQAALSAVSQSGGSGVGSAEAGISGGRTVLRGFMFHFQNSDHHISKISVAPSNGKMRVSYRDKNGDDGFAWRVQWATLRN